MAIHFSLPGDLPKPLDDDGSQQLDRWPCTFLGAPFASWPDGAPPRTQSTEEPNIYCYPMTGARTYVVCAGPLVTACLFFLMSRLPHLGHSESAALFTQPSFEVSLLDRRSQISRQ